MKTLHTIIGISTLLLAVNTVAASEVTGTLSTGLGNSSVTGIVIAAPSASPVAGTYTGTQGVTLTSSGSLHIRYTVDGTTPSCSSGLLYSSAVSVASSLTLKAVSCYANNVASPVASYAYTISAPVVSGGGGGGGGGGGSFIFVPPVVATTTATTTRVTTVGGTATVLATTTASGGQVLGASTVNFLVDLKLGSRGKDVLELQKFLIAQGFLKIDTPTTYFGVMTRNAVVAFQKKNKITPAAGYFGKLTRTLVNKINKGL